MARIDEHPDNAAELRQRAEASFRGKDAQSLETLAELPPEAIGRMLHELRVHQIELEMQNEELRRAQVELEASRERYFDLYDLAPVGYCTLSEHGLILQANLKASALFGVARGELVKKNIANFIFVEDQGIYYRFRKQIIDTEEPQWCDLRMVKHDGTTSWAQLAATSVQEEDGKGVLRLVINDISDRKRVEAEREALDRVLLEKNVELEHSMYVAEKANLAKSVFLSSMSHELRTPLSAILGFSQLLASGTPQPTPSQQRSIDQVLKAGWYLLELINEILDLTVIESGKLTLSMAPVLLAEVLHECESMIEPQAQKIGIGVTFLRIDSPYVVHADRVRIKQVVINLLSNAIKYNSSGGTVVVECIPGLSDSIRISIRDTGAGLTPEQLEQLFQPFNRLGQQAGIIEGTGIGLVVSKRLIEFMGGSIGVESTVGKGSVFWIELKLANEEQTTSASAALAGAQGQTDTSLRTLLYVEDNPANLMLVEEIISHRPNIRFLSATDGMGGIEIAHRVHPDVILMDINLPGISGLEALKILNEDPETAHIPVLALSANAMPHDVEKGLEAGFLRYLTKPIKINEFLAALDVALNFNRISRATRGTP